MAVEATAPVDGVADVASPAADAGGRLDVGGAGDLGLHPAIRSSGSMSVADRVPARTRAMPLRLMTTLY
ncbi:MAG TPA: hypothetical protein VND54_05555 [Candidatus Saccharimonadales bacterium]|nr:hypothetical protein [Candidatus Saccharimonadales bacterium]